VVVPDPFDPVVVEILELVVVPDPDAVPQEAKNPAITRTTPSRRRRDLRPRIIDRGVDLDTKFTIDCRFQIFMTPNNLER